MSRGLGKLFILFLTLSVLLWLLFLGACSLLFTYPPYVVASIMFPSDGLRVQSDGLFVVWRAEYQPLQVVVNTSTGLRSETAEHVLYLDGQPIAFGDSDSASYRGIYLPDVSTGIHTLRLEARAAGRTVFHEVTFHMEAGPGALWRVETVPYEFGRRFAFDAQGRMVTLPKTDTAPTPDVAHMDHRGLFEMQGAFSGAPRRLFFRPWVWEQLGTAEELPLPGEGEGMLVGPGFWMGDRLYAWEEGTWLALPPLPLPDTLAKELAWREDRPVEQAILDFYGYLYMWVRRCEDMTWVSITWIVPAKGRPDHWPYVARLVNGQWELVPPPTPHGAYTLFCFGRYPYLVAIASATAELEPGQFTQWAAFLNVKDSEEFAEAQNLGYAYVWTGTGWLEEVAPPLVKWLDQQGNWVPTPYGPAPHWFEAATYYVAVPNLYQARPLGR